MLKKACPELQPSSVKLHTYTGEFILALGEITVNMAYKSQQERFSVVLVKGVGPSLLGRDWLQKFWVDWKEVCNMTTSLSLEEVRLKHTELFKDELGTAVKHKVDIQVPPEAMPVFHNPRPVPYALREKVDQELLSLEELGVIEAIKSSDWVAPIVPVVKSDGSIRICGDFHVTVNKIAKTNVYTLPKIEDLFACLRGGQTFTKLDVAHAYLQFPLEESSKKFVTINTHKG